MRRRKGEGFSQGVDTQRESTIIQDEGVKMITRKSATYRGVKAVRRAHKEEIFDRVMIEIETYHNRTYHFAIKADQLKELLYTKEERASLFDKECLKKEGG